MTMLVKMIQYINSPDFRYFVSGAFFAWFVVDLAAGVLWMATRSDFINLQESIAGFGSTMTLAKLDLERQEEERK